MATPIAAQTLRAPLRFFNVSATLLRSFDLVRVTFAFEPERPGSEDDRVAAYCLDDKDARDNEDSAQLLSLEAKEEDFMDVQRIRESSGAFASSGSLTFGPLVNMRCAWQFRFVASDQRVLAISPLIRFVDGAQEPTQIHLALTTESTEMRVTWTSVQSASARPVVRYGASNDSASLLFEVPATSTSYEASDMCAGPATTIAPRYYRDPGRFYSAVMTGLRPNATYFYRVGYANTSSSNSSGSGSAMSEIKQFFVPPAPGTAPSQDIPGRSMSFAVFGDLAATATATGDFMVQGGCGTTMQRIERDIVASHSDDSSLRSYAAVFHIGDLAYARGRTYLWDQFGFMIEGAASRVPYMIGIGNHDYGYKEGNAIDSTIRFPVHPLFDEDGAGGYDSSGECAVPIVKRFEMPSNGNGVFWYSTEMGLTHHTVLSSEHDFRRGSPMHSWLVKNLRSVNRTRTPWLFLHIHRPLYCSETYTSDYRRSLLLRNHLEHLLSEHRVDVVFSGHYHSYERTCPVYDEQCFHGVGHGRESLAQAPVHLMVGSGGANVDSQGYYDRDWSLRVLQEYGYGRVHVYNATHMHFEFVANEEMDNDGVKDDVWIVSDHAWPNDRPRQMRMMPWSVWEVAVVVGAVSLLLLLGFMVLKPRRAAELLRGSKSTTPKHHAPKKREHEGSAAVGGDDANDDERSDDSDRLLVHVQ